MIWIATLPVSGDTGRASLAISRSQHSGLKNVLSSDCQDSYAKGGSEASTDGDILQLDILHESSLIKGFG